MLGHRLYVLSAESGCIAELTSLPGESGGIVGLQREPWTLPAEIERPEGLVILASSRRPLVAADLPRDDPGDNVFLLDPLAASVV